MSEASEARRERLADGLAAFLGEQWGERVQVDGLIETSAGARRGNVLFDAHRADGTTLGLCATILPTRNIELMSISDEAALLRAAEAGGVPVPHVHFDTESEAWVGGPLFISERVAGESVPRRVLRLVERAGNGETLTAELGRAFAALHTTPVASAPDALARPEGAPAEQALTRLVEQVAGLLQPAPAFNLALRWLERHLPRTSERPTLVHGDIRNGNILVSEQGLAAVLDWEVAKLGDPMEDLAWPCLRTWRFGNDHLEVGGFGERRTLAAAYDAGGGRFDPDAFHWWKVLGTMRWGLGLAGQAKGHLDGSFSNIVMAASGRRVAELEYDLLCLLRPSSAR